MTRLPPPPPGHRPSCAAAAAGRCAVIRRRSRSPPPNGHCLKGEGTRQATLVPLPAGSVERSILLVNTTRCVLVTHRATMQAVKIGDTFAVSFTKITYFARVDDGAAHELSFVIISKEAVPRRARFDFTVAISPAHDADGISCHGRAAPHGMLFKKIAITRMRTSLSAAPLAYRAIPDTPGD